MKFNPLIVILSPRDIGLVREQIQNIIHPQFDTIWVKYFPAPASYNIAAQTFLRDFPDHNYLCLIPDDVVINQKAWDILVKQTQTGKYDVISGVCNQQCNSDLKIEQTNITLREIPDFGVLERSYIEKLWVLFRDLPLTDEPMKVAFAGFPVMFIKKKILKKVGEFTADWRGQNRDVEFCKKLKKHGIDIWVVPSARFLHLKHHPDPELNSFNIFVGKKYPKILHYEKEVENVIPLLR